MPSPEMIELTNQYNRLAEQVQRLMREHRRLLIALAPLRVCMNSACATGDMVPHMMDERDHRTYGEVLNDAQSADQ